MNALTTLAKDNSIKLSSKIEEFLSPDYVYIPIEPGFRLMVKNQESVKKEQCILEKENRKILSPVSGKVVGAKSCMTCDGSMINCIVIENDYKETLIRTKRDKKEFSSFTKEELIAYLKENDIYDNATKMFLTSKLENLETIDTLIIYGVEPELYLASKIFLMQNYVSELLETMDALREILHVSRCIFAMKSNDSENAGKYNNYLGTYPGIELRFVPNYYPIANEKILTSYLMASQNNNILVLDINIVYELYLRFKKNRHLTEKYITVTGNGIVSPKVVLAKIGSPFHQIMHDFFEQVEDAKVVFVANGLMTGVAIRPEELIVTDALEGVIIAIDEQEKETPCINCGLCREICPVKANPKYVYDHAKEDAKCKKDRDKCVHCGLCSYICPAKINLRKYLKGDDHE